MRTLALRPAVSGPPWSPQTPLRLDPLEESRLKVLRVPPRRGRLPAPAFGMLPLLPPGREELEGPPVAFADVLAWARGHLYSGVGPLHSALVSLNELCAHVGDQLLWCIAPLSEAFKVRRCRSRGG